jgi:hypothetical protein
MSQSEANQPHCARTSAAIWPRAHIDAHATRAIVGLVQRFGASSATAAGSSATWTAPAFSSR